MTAISSLEFAQTQLRNCLASDLLRSAEGAGTSVGDSLGHDHGHATGRGGTLRKKFFPVSHQLSDALVRQHLEASKYDYTLSVFLAETGGHDSQVPW